MKNVESRALIEGNVLEIFRQVLEREEIGVAEHLFDLDGDSFSAVEISTLLYERHNFRISPADVFSAGSVAGIAAAIHNSDA